MEPDENDKNELISRCLDEYKDNDSEQTHIHEFQTSYSSSKAIWWYTRESFVYKTLNSALRKQTIHMMFLYRSFIFDLWEQLAEHQSQIELTVYRSQLISMEELELLKRNVDKLISVNSFFSSSCDRYTALFLLGDTGSPIESERVLFEIKADPRKANSKPFSDVSNLSEFTQEAEVLFMLGSIFRVKSVDKPAEDPVWTIRLELCSDDEHDLSYVLAKMKSQNGSGQTNLHTLGKILSTMGKFDLAEYYYQRLLGKLSAEDSRHKTLYEALAEVASHRGNFDASIQWKYEAIKFDELFTSSRRNSKLESADNVHSLDNDS
jgi:tetratricopeptide (TPR) repeat protein